MQNLRDKLLKAGVVSEEQTRQAEEQLKNKAAPKAPNTTDERSYAPPHAPMIPIRRAAPRSTPRNEAPIPKLPPLALPGSKAHQRLEALKQADLNKHLRELALTTQVDVEPGSHAFHFVTRKGKLRRLDMSEVQAKQLELGSLAVVERPDPAQIEHALVPAATAEKMLRLSDKAVRFFNRDGKPVGFVNDDEPGDEKEPAPAPEVPAPPRD
jgi:hypothetical protein